MPRRAGRFLAALVPLAAAAVIGLPGSMPAASATPVAPPVPIPVDAAGTAAVSGEEAATLGAACAETGPAVAMCAGAAVLTQYGFYLGKTYLGPKLFKLFGWGGAGDVRTVQLGDATMLQQVSGSTALPKFDPNDVDGSWTAEWTTYFGGAAVAGQADGYGAPRFFIQMDDQGNVGRTIYANAPLQAPYLTHIRLGAEHPPGNTDDYWQLCVSNLRLYSMDGQGSAVPCADNAPIQAQIPAFAGNGFAQVEKVGLRDWGGHILSEIDYDVGYGQPWSITYTETCRRGTLTANTSASISYVPQADTAAPFPNNLKPCDQILPGSHIDQISATGGRGGGQDVAVTVPTFSDGAVSSYPGCTASMNTSHPCLLDLQRNGVSCENGGAACQDWTTYESEMTCHWGNDVGVDYIVPIKWCEDEWSTAFDGQVQPSPTSTATGTGGTGTSESAAPSASVTPGGAGFPDSGSTPGGDPSGGTDPGGESCMSAFWSWNPLDWVFTPVKCAWKWAMVPHWDAIQAAWTDAYGQISSRPPFSVASAAASVVGNFADAGLSGSCDGNLAEFHIENGDGQDVVPCDPPGWLSPWLTPLYVLLEVALVVWAGFIIWGMVESGLASH